MSPPNTATEPHRPGLHRFVAAWKWGRYVVGLALAGLAVWAVAGKTDELSGATAFLNHIRWPWLVLAAVAEAASYLAFANMLRRLLRAGGLDVPIPTVTGISVAATAIQTTLPAGIVLSAAFTFRQFRRYGADEALAAWVLIAMTLISFATLAAIAAVGLGLAFGSGSALNLVSVIVGIVAVAALLIVAWVKRAAWVPWLDHVIRAVQRVTHRPSGDAEKLLEEWIERVSAITPGRADWTAASIMALGNWVTDLGCLTLSFLAVGADVPWPGLLLAYGAAQLATNLPITPGGLGVVEGSLTVALVAFGGVEASTVAAVLLYRLFSFWAMLPIGWSAWGVFTVLGRRRDRAARATFATARVPQT